MRQPTRHTQTNDAPGSDGIMRPIQHTAPTLGCGAGGLRARKEFAIDQTGQGQRAQAVSGLLQKRPAIDAEGEGGGVKGVHTMEKPNTKIQTQEKHQIPSSELSHWARE